MVRVEREIEYPLVRTSDFGRGNKDLPSFTECKTREDVRIFKMVREFAQRRKSCFLLTSDLHDVLIEELDPNHVLHSYDMHVFLAEVLRDPNVPMFRCCFDFYLQVVTADATDESMSHVSFGHRVIDVLLTFVRIFMCVMLPLCSFNLVLVGEWDEEQYRIFEMLKMYASLAMLLELFRAVHLAFANYRRERQLNRRLTIESLRQIVFGLV